VQVKTHGKCDWEKNLRDNIEKIKVNFHKYDIEYESKKSERIILFQNASISKDKRACFSRTLNGTQGDCFNQQFNMNFPKDGY